MDSTKLIIGYLNKTLHEQELEEFFLWLDASPENKKEYFRLKAVYDFKYSKAKNLNTNESWLRFRHKAIYQTRKTLIKRTLSYAAVVLISVFCTIVISQLSQPKEVNTLTQYVGGNGIESDKLVLPDGTQVSIGANTCVSYQHDYGRTERKIILTGEAFFEVAPNKEIPFIVYTKSQNIEALGTKFNVMAYPSDSISVTTLLEGSVRITLEDLHQEPFVLRPDQQLEYNNLSNTLSLREVEAELYTSWTNGYYYFKEQSMDEITKKLSSIYGFTYEIVTEERRNTIFTGIFYKGQSVKEIMEIINISVPIKYKIEKNHLTIY